MKETMTKQLFPISFTSYHASKAYNLILNTTFTNNIIENIGMLDSGTSGNFISMRIKVKNIHPPSIPINVILPESSRIEHEYEID